MQQYLFRGKTISGQWVYGDLIQRQYSTKIGCYVSMAPTWQDPCGDEVYTEHEVIGDTVGQFTGLKDKDGKDIYEGDIYRPQHSQEHYQVMFVSGAFAGGKNKDACMPIGWTPDIEHDDIVTESSKWMIVVSTIHDNPELVNPAAKEQLTNTMINDPNTQTAEGQQEVTEQVAATESAAQDNAMEVSAEEGGTEG
jgi:hypothetical protein